MPGAAEHVREVQRRHGVDVGAVTSVAALSVEALRVALALAEGADPEDIATQLRLTSRRVAVVRERLLALLGIDYASTPAGFLAPPRVVSGRVGLDSVGLGGRRIVRTEKHKEDE